jgi:hypothetical protein
MKNLMQPDRDQIEIFVDGLFRHASPKGFVSLRAFYEEDAAKPFRISPTGLSGGLKFLIDVAQDDALRAANYPKPVVFCPPIATFADKDHARERDIAEGLALSVECDARPHQARAKLEAILGPATIVVRSGGKWTDPETGEIHDKLHLHWRLREPARGDDLPALKRARDIAARLVGGDPSNKPICHPIRWPGSWHRKGKPILCSIETANPDREIDLAAGLAALADICPEQPQQRTNGKDYSGDATDWASQIQNIITGDSYHGALVSLAAKVLTAGMSDGAAVNLLRGIMGNSTAPRDARWDARYADIPRAVSTAREKFGQAPNGIPPNQQQPNNHGEQAPIIKSTTWQWRDPTELERRKWLHARHYIRGEVTSTVGKRGGGKTNRTIVEMLSMITGRDLLKTGTTPGGQQRCWYIGEDSRDEIEMRVVAACDHYGIKREEIGDRLAFNSIYDFPSGALKLATLQNAKVVRNEPAIAAIKADMLAKKTDVLLLDPLKKFHGLRESDQEMDDVMTILSEIAKETNSAVEFLHHTRKQSSGAAAAQITADDARGADAIIAGPRDVRLVNPMSAKEATEFGIPAAEAWRYSRIDDGKQNLKPPGKAEWTCSASITLPCGESVGVLQSWQPPKPFDGILATDMATAQQLARTGAYRADSRADNWFGYALGKVLGFDPRNKPQDKAKLAFMIKTWIGNKVLATEEREDEKRKLRPFIIPGTNIAAQRDEGTSELD